MNFYFQLLCMHVLTFWSKKWGGGGGASPRPTPRKTLAKAEIIKVVALQYEIIYNDQSFSPFTNVAWEFCYQYYCFCCMISLSAGTVIIFIVILCIIVKENYKPKVVPKKSCQGR